MPVGEATDGGAAATTASAPATPTRSLAPWQEEQDIGFRWRFPSTWSDGSMMAADGFVAAATLS